MPNCHMPIVVSRSQWEHLHRWTHRNQEEVEKSQKQEYIKYLNETSKQMTKSWPNSVENINKRNEEMRRARQESAEKANAEFYQKYVKRKQEEQRKMMHSARDTIFKNKDAPKLLLSAVIESVTQKDRQQQVKFLKERQKEGAELTRQRDEDVLTKAKEWNELQELKRRRRFEINKQHQKEILEQAREIAERNQREYEEELNMQKIDNLKAREEIEAIKEFEENFRAHEKARIRSAMETARAQTEQLRGEQRARALMDERLQEVLLRSKATIQHKIAQVDRKARDEKLRMLEAISKRLVSDDASRDDREQACLNNAIQERIDKENARMEAKRQKEEKMRRERVEAHRAHLDNEAQRLHDFNTLRQWDIMNRFKNVEIYDDFKEEKRQKNHEKTKEYRERLLEQWREREEREARERQETRQFYGELALSKMRDADSKLLQHGAALLEEARREGRPEYPIRRAIDRYCRLNSLYRMPELPASMQEHFPRYEPQDRTQPDPWYTVDTPAPTQQRFSDDELKQPSTEYKQIDDVHTDNTKVEQKLPPITTIPCPSARCPREVK